MYGFRYFFRYSAPIDGVVVELNVNVELSTDWPSMKKNYVPCKPFANIMKDKTTHSRISAEEHKQNYRSFD